MRKRFWLFFILTVILTYYFLGWIFAFLLFVILSPVLFRPK
jgi:hypothetical protein